MKEFILFPKKTKAGNNLYISTWNVLILSFSNLYLSQLFKLIQI